MKTKLLFIIFLIFYLGIVIKLFYLQILSPLKVNKGLYLKTQKLLPERGRIYDKNQTPLVLNQNSYLLYLEPKKINDKLKLTKFLSEKLEMEEASLEARVDETKDWISIVGAIDEEKKKEIESLKIAGVGFNQEMKRFYPEASLSAHLLGFVGKNKDGEDTGYFGLEGFYDKDLSGLPGLLDSERDIIGRPIFLGIQNKVEAEDGRDLILTVDKSCSSENLLC